MPLPDDVIPQSIAYAMVVNAILVAWRTIYPGEELQLSGSSSEAQFGSCMVELRKKMHSAADHKLWADYFDVVQLETIEDTFRAVVANEQTKNKISDADDLTPKQFKAAVYLIASELGESGKAVDVALSQFLKLCLKNTFEKSRLEGRLNVGANRHFPRLYQWLAEVEAETDWPGGQGLRIKQIGGAGRVPAEPTDPKTLKVTIKKDWL